MRWILRHTGLLILCLSISIHLLAAPFTKVEESFNTQAVHDLLYQRSCVRAYDHLEFSGVVPRSFLGALVVALITAPRAALHHLIGLSKLHSLCAARITLGGLSLASFAFFGRAVQKLSGLEVANAMYITTALQFHLPFYCSRFLPNTFALAINCLAYGTWLTGKLPAATIALLAVSSMVFRCDMLPLAALIGLHMLLTKQCSFLQAVKWGVAALVLALSLTVGVDSLLWQRLLWPEGEVLWFNSVLNKSSEWGTQPFHWYWTSAMPRALLGALPLAAFGWVSESRLHAPVGIATLYTCLYSWLPHKEVRFLFPVLPLFNLAAAVGLIRLRHNRNKSAGQQLAWLSAVALLTATAGASMLMLYISAHNYPGGDALCQLHRQHAAGGIWWRDDSRNGGNNVTNSSSTEAPLFVHIGVLPAMTGASRFLEKEPPWQYSKEEGLSQAELLSGNFTFMLTESPSMPGCELIHTSSVKRLSIKLSGLSSLFLDVVSGKIPELTREVPQVHTLKCDQKHSFDVNNSVVYSLSGQSFVEAAA